MLASRLTSSWRLRTVPTNTIALIAPLLELQPPQLGDLATAGRARLTRHCRRGAHPCEQHGRSSADYAYTCEPHVLVQRVGAPAGSRRHRVPHRSGAIDGGRVPSGALRVAPCGTALLCCGRGSRALGALQESLLSLNLRGEDALRKVPELMSNADRPPARSARSRQLGAAHTPSDADPPAYCADALAHSERLPEPPAGQYPATEGGERNEERSCDDDWVPAEVEEDVDCTVLQGARAPVRMMGRRHSAFREAHGWKSFQQPRTPWNAGRDLFRRVSYAWATWHTWARHGKATGAENASAEISRRGPDGLMVHGLQPPHTLSTVDGVLG